jgi:hypothetical protein
MTEADKDIVQRLLDLECHSMVTGHKDHADTCTMAHALIHRLSQENEGLRNQLHAAKSYLTEHDENRLWSPKRGGWKRWREDGAFVSADAPDGMGDYAAGWKACLRQIVDGLTGFKTETGCSAMAAVGVMQSWIRSHEKSAAAPVPVQTEK